MTRGTFVRSVVATSLATGVSTVALPISATPTPVVSAAWSRPTLQGDTGVIYATIHSIGADALLGATSPLAMRVELHESMTEKTGGMPGMGAMDMTSMHPVARLPIPAGGTVRLAPGGYHLMLVGVRRDLTAGMHVPVVLRFAHAGTVRATATVRAA